MAKKSKKKPEPRKALHAYLSDEAHSAWHDFAAKHGISASATLEVLAPRLDSLVDGDIVKEARAVDTERRRRDRS